jgi:hypothetical protein
MLDLIAACLVGTFVLNAAPATTSKPPRQLAPQSNPYVCGNPLTSQNQDLCDRQRYSGHGG